MYEELTKALRKQAHKLPEKFSRNAENIDLFLKSADAIEELSKQHEAQTQNIIALLNEKPRWIPVTDQLPEERGNYLVVINCPRGQWDEICAFDVEKEWVSIDEYAEIATKWVTHWMPLPQPPKEEQT